MLSPLYHHSHKPRLPRGMVGGASPSTHRGWLARVADLPLALLLHYKIVLAAVWVAGMGFWLAQLIFPTRFETQEYVGASPTPTEMESPTPTLVSDTRTEVSPSRDED